MIVIYGLLFIGVIACSLLLFVVGVVVDCCSLSIVCWLMRDMLLRVQRCWVFVVCISLVFVVCCWCMSVVVVVCVCFVLPFFVMRCCLWRVGCCVLCVVIVCCLLSLSVFVCTLFVVRCLLFVVDVVCCLLLVVG